MRFDGITIISDMDGTLLTNEKKISEENIKTIDYFKKNGGTFTIASGRIYSKVLIYANELKLDVPFISHNGGVIYDLNSQKTVYRRTLDSKAVKVLKEIIEKFPNAGYEVASCDDVYFIKDNPFIQKHIEDENFTDQKWIDIDEINFDMTKILIADFPENLEIMEREIPPIYSKYSFFRSDRIYFEMVPVGVSKGTALPHLREMLGSRASKIYAIGDNMNDSELLNASDFGVAVKNASSSLKCTADFILPFTNEESAPARLIELIAKGII